MIFSPADGPNPWTARAGLLVTLLLSAASAGCGQRACIEWSASEGMCPSSAETLKDHLGTCTNITSVDGEGVHEGDLCCYPVTKNGPLPDCINEETTSSGPRPPPGPVTTGSGFSCGDQGFCGSFLNNGCSACSIGNLCSAAWNDCQSSNGCFNIVSCVASCSEGDLACQQVCEKPNQDGLPKYHALAQCVFCNECFNDCASPHSDECFGTSTGMGVGGAGGMSGTGGAGGAGGKAP